MRVVRLYLFCSRRLSPLSFLSFLLFMYVWSLARSLLYPTCYYMLPRAYLHLYSTSRHPSFSLARPAPTLTRATHIRVHRVVILVQTQIQTNAYSQVMSAARSSSAEARSRDLGTRTQPHMRVRGDRMRTVQYAARRACLMGLFDSVPQGASGSERRA
ncbi:hypothetical protein HETIRDRAFT_323627 [Heterobasidion irregulare TC 32-1]|uniref:Uncharacterized protein n=1 Tax=Heterobasidion irregulare (strain TC 32-1) TaxID=747525 RepID=W4K0W0_HETIT|nr:uncharacterized protein HETIRDRAFT_323627 [Heterobasidion irregulare TC 32-1]ETW78970.1 hypothetical protein HETIRDRAFT_323627 [Heterobasidion irregulare TC 32-1]